MLANFISYLYITEIDVYFKQNIRLCNGHAYFPSSSQLLLLQKTDSKSGQPIPHEKAVSCAITYISKEN